MKMKIGIIIGSTRSERVGDQVGQWVLEQSKELGHAEYELVDIKSFNLPFIGTTDDQREVMKWNQKLSELDGFLFVVSEYNHSISGALKNALDLAKDNWNNKAAAIVSYGSAGGARAAEHLRGILGELQVADVRSHVLLSLFEDFKNWTVFKPRDIHKPNLEMLFKQLEDWTKAISTLRN
jgi:NAD(P)H-dependent FMN reductase